MRIERIGELLKFDIRQARVNRWLDAFIRQAIIYGCSPVKIFWKVRQTTNYKRRRKTPEE